MQELNNERDYSQDNYTQDLEDDRNIDDILGIEVNDYNNDNILIEDVDVIIPLNTDDDDNNMSYKILNDYEMSLVKQSGGNPGAIAGIAIGGVVLLPVIAASIVGTLAILMIGYSAIRLVQAILRKGARVFNKNDILENNNIFEKPLKSVINMFPGRKSQNGGNGAKKVKDIIALLLTKCALNPKEVIDICKSNEKSIPQKLFAIAKTKAVKRTVLMSIVGIGSLKIFKQMSSSDSNSPFNAINSLKNVFSKSIITRGSRYNMYGGGNEDEEEDLTNISNAFENIVNNIEKTNNVDKTKDNEILQYIQPSYPITSFREDCKNIFDFYNDDLLIRGKIINSDLLYLTNNVGNSDLNKIMSIVHKLYKQYNDIVTLSKNGTIRNKRCITKKLPFTYVTKIHKFMIRSQKLQHKVSEIIKNIEARNQQKINILSGGDISYVKTDKRVKIINTSKTNTLNKGRTRVVYHNNRKEYVIFNNDYVLLSSLRRSKKYYIEVL